MALSADSASPSAPARAAPTSRHRRPNVWLGRAIPLLLLVFAVRGYSLVLLEIIPLLWSRRPVLAALYSAAVHFLLVMTGISYFAVYFLPIKPPPLNEPPLPVREKQVIFACDPAGEPLRCFRDECGGAWQSTRTRHCRDCGTCRPIFDHHCAFVANDVCGSTLKPFATFLAYAAALLVVALVPFAPLQWRACREVVSETWWSDEMQDGWWSGWRGWIGGPIYRYAGALLLGYRQYQRSAAERPHPLGDGALREVDSLEAALYPHLVVPSISMLLVTFFASFISVIALVMLYVVVRNARQGRTSVQGERIKLHRSATYDARLSLWVPLPEGGGAVVLVEPDHDLFDLGADENWRTLMGETWLEWASPWKPSRVSDFVMNPKAVRELEDRARKEL
ncbi:hypothetical protein JCM9279_005603 [Rhodotorula babjevae]